jgi:hypothetical protein
MVWQCRVGHGAPSDPCIYCPACPGMQQGAHIAGPATLQGPRAAAAEMMAGEPGGVAAAQQYAGHNLLLPMHVKDAGCPEVVRC